ncbi:MAG: hypothetical protein JNM56_35870, partial [Planctomycetia bacterium]|nr:hypothetical protein [Planctomycetia bacterium]
GAYAFEAVPAGEYRVRRVTEGTAGKANGQTIKITGDGKPQTLNFGKPMKRGKVLDHRVHPPIASAVDEVVPFRESTWADAIDRVFQEWDQYGSSLVLLDTDEDDAVATVSLGLFCLTPIALVSLASTRRGCAADTDRRAGASGPQTT